MGLFSKIFEMATEKAYSDTCPDCGAVGSLEDADDTVKVCRVCGYSIDIEDVQSEWQDKLEDEMGFNDPYTGEDEEDD